ncbi:NADH-quinone oxidoreductase subunit C [Streptomyces sp. NBC_00006]|uniref:NADH-quinone oxidoreductase subunit C n=1 Tax=Streptomyces sp. NBC_00006 TaxID=2975619 RepID=UPI0022523C44|nr:NADH-quinone oxidoreductase subunit C [Streptomyces sp. NBC_00006]MCX5531919.1 NADH-quinone oxidoreductase subunit C [Streptomyces sp. NBC_00006]
MSWLPAPVEELFGAEATVEEAYDLLTVDVPAAEWIAALTTARTTLECTYFDWLSAVDEPEAGFRVCAHVAAVAPRSVRRLLLRTTVPHAAPVLASAVDVYAGAAWHERETHEMFGVDFTDHPGLDPLLLPDGFEGHPLRKDFVLAARVAKAWPGAKEPGESEHGGPKRRQILPPGVPDPNEWGPLKGQLPPAPARPARGARAAGAAGAGAAGRTAGAAGAAGAEGRAAGERPARRARSASQGSASQAAASAGEASEAPKVPDAPKTPEAPEAPEASPRPARRSRSASQGSASQSSASQRETPTEPPAQSPEPAPKPRSSDAPWHHAKPAFDEESKKPEPTPDEPPTDTPANKPETPTGNPADKPETPTDTPETPTDTPETPTDTPETRPNNNGGNE